MLISKRKALIMSVLCAVTSIGFIHSASAAEETMSGTLDEIIIEETGDVLPGGMIATKQRTGIMGEKDIIDTPFTQSNFTEKSINTFDFIDQPITGILANVPSVITFSGDITHTDFSMRGIRMNGSEFYVNNIPGMVSQLYVPMFPFEKVDVTSGPNMGLNGTTNGNNSMNAVLACPGIINLTSKKATDKPITRYKQSFSGKGVLGEYIDIGRRFGENNEWGIRVNAANIQGETALDNAKKTERGIFVNADHRDEKSNTNLLMGYSYFSAKNGLRWFNLNKSTTIKDIVNGKFDTLPSAPDSDTNFSFEGAERSGSNKMFTINHEQKFNDNWGGYIDVGMNRYHFIKNVGGNSSAYQIINQNGDLEVTNKGGGNSLTELMYAQVGLRGKFDIGAIENKVNIAFDKNWTTSKSGFSYKFGTGGQGNDKFFWQGNLQTGIAQNMDYILRENHALKLSSKKQHAGVSFADEMSFGKWDALIGIHHHSAKVTSYSDSGSKTVTSGANCPTYALTYKPTDDMAIYASHSESFTQGSIVSEKKEGNEYVYKNHGDILNPAKMKQNEVGLKFQNKGVLSTLSYFTIENAGNIEVDRPDGTYYLQDGKDKYKGVELTVQGKIAPKINLMGGLTYMDTEYEQVANGEEYKLGKRISGVPKWNGVLSIEYEADKDFSVIGRANYTGEAPFVGERLHSPDYVTFDLGMRYKTRVNTVPVTFNAMCYNLTDKNYWIPKASSDQLVLSMPRTFVLSAAFDI